MKTDTKLKMRQKVKTSPDLGASSLAHREALDKGDSHYKSWQHNVADHFKDKSEEEIKQSLRETANPFAVCFEHWIGDFNMGAGIRNANGFNAKEVFYVGDKKWDRRSSVGVYNYTPVKWLSTIEEFQELKNEYTIVGIDNVPGSVPLSTYRWKPNTLMVFGEEGTGLTPAMQVLCEDIVAIEMYGSVRSFNCGVASGILMYDFVRQMKSKYSDSRWDE